MRLVQTCLSLLIAFTLSVSAASAQTGTVSSADPRATEAGRDILRQGGSATDATMAMMLVLTLVEPQSSGIGGGGFLVHNNAQGHRVETVDGREAAPSSATSTLFLGADGKPLPFREAVPGGRSVGVPGNIALMAIAHRKWGKLRWSAIFQPAIRLAEAGFVVTPRLANAVGQMGRLWGDFPETRALYSVNGRPVQAGDTLKNPAYAAVLRVLAKRGPKAFYTGQNAKAIIAATGQAKRNPVVMTAKDLARYRAKERPSVCAPYRVYTICGMGPPSSGATSVLQMLGMLERFDLKALGPDNAKSWHLIGEAMRLAYADRETYLADADFVKVPVAGLLDRGYVASRSALISEERAMAVASAGTPPGAEPRTAALSGEVAGTTHFLAVDKAGNIATMTSTVEGPFGSQLVANGYILNNELTDFTHAPEKDGKPVANRVEAGKRPLSSMAPTIVYDAKGQPVFTVGAAGGKTIIMQVAKTLIAHLDWGMDAKAAIAAPNIYFSGDANQIEAGTPAAALVPEIARYGRTILTLDMPRLKANAAQRTPQGWIGAADPRSEGTALQE